MKRSIQFGLPSIDSLIVFEQVAELLSVTQAGTGLGLTQSAVSRHVIDLEELLGIKLFVREKQRLKLTSEGTEFRELIRPHVQGLRAATLRMQTGVANNVLRLSVAASFCNLWFVSNLPHYLAREGASQVHVMPHIGKISADIQTLDAAIVNSDRPPEGCEFIKLIDIEVVPYAAPQLLERFDAARLEDFARIPAIDLRDVGGSWPRYLAHVGLPHLGFDYVGSNWLFLLNYEAALAGMGVALLPPEFVAAADRHGGLKRLHASQLPVGRSYYFCYWPTVGAKRDAVVDLGQWLQQEVRNARVRGSRTP